MDWGEGRETSPIGWLLQCCCLRIVEISGERGFVPRGKDGWRSGGGVGGLKDPTVWSQFQIVTVADTKLVEMGGASSIVRATMVYLLHYTPTSAGGAGFHGGDNAKRAQWCWAAS